MYALLLRLVYFIFIVVENIFRYCWLIDQTSLYPTTYILPIEFEVVKNIQIQKNKMLLFIHFGSIYMHLGS